MKIFALPSHQEKEKTHGVDFARVIQPMTHLNNVEGFDTTLFDINKETDWLTVSKNYDAIFLNYINNPWGFAAMGAMARKHGVKLIMDVDDNIWGLQDDNPAYEVYKKGSKALFNFTAICNEVDYITCTSKYLKNVILSNTNKRGGQVRVFPNYIDLDMYKHRAKFKDDNKISILHFGSTTHFNDLATDGFVQGMDKIMREYPHVMFRTVGALIPKFKQRWGARYENPFGAMDIYDWIQKPDKFAKFVDEADFLVVPLTNSIYNRCKSNIKWLEASSAGLPGVWQKIRQYEEVVDGQNGILANTHRDWYRGMKKMIDDQDFRKSAGEKTFQDVQKHQIQDHIGDYAEFFKEALDNG